ncbi:hypothetical protein PFLU3_33500 [Pseudomonas fluorescens]|uniref:Uncharacterized protein n=1 Tax=Pseudomonas fluorescens TaxID=294 RepID=A0A0D0TC92_PSEFL|nr:hypothetical protein PFLU3_33500 [Pseudomonas fluorescens]
MHQHLGLRQGTVDQLLADTLPEGLLLGIKVDPQVPAYIPLREQFQLAAQQGHVVAGQWLVHRQLLEREQRIDGIGK